MAEQICKCGRKLILSRRHGLRLGNDVWGIGGKVTFWWDCPARRWWNAWKHSAPVAAGTD